VVPIPRACLPPHDKYPFCDPAVALHKVRKTPSWPRSWTNFSLS
jgi:hypothetical protein